MIFPIENRKIDEKISKVSGEIQRLSGDNRKASGEIQWSSGENRKASGKRGKQVVR